MPAPVSLYDMTSGVIPGTICPFDQYLNPSNISQATTSNGTAVCGYS